MAKIIIYTLEKNVSFYSTKHKYKIMKYTNNIIKIISKTTYNNAHIDKYKIYAENKSRSDIYVLNNLITGKCYIGSSISLSSIFSCYYSLPYLNKSLKGSSSMIYSTLLKHGYSNFSLHIIEYCKPIELIVREQYYIDLPNPEYKIFSSNSEAAKYLGVSVSTLSIYKRKGKILLKIYIITNNIDEHRSYK